MKQCRIFLYLLKKQSGFTLVELFLVMMLMGLSTAALVTQLDFSETRVHTATLKVSKDIQFAQNRAMVTGVMHGFRTVTGTQYEIYEETPGNPVQDPSTGLNMLIDLTNTYGAVNFGDVYQVEFDGLGSPTLGGGAAVTLALGEVNRTFTVEDNTGHINLP